MNYSKRAGRIVHIEIPLTEIMQNLEKKMQLKKKNGTKNGQK